MKIIKIIKNAIQTNKLLNTSWVPKLDLHKLLGVKRIRGYCCMQIEDKKIEFTIKNKKEYNTYFLGTTEGTNYLKQSKINRFIIGNWKEYEYTLFLLVRATNNNWYIYRNDCEKMFKVVDLNILNYKFVWKIMNKFKEIGISWHGILP